MNHTVLQLALNKDDIPASKTLDAARKFATVIINNLQSGPAIGHNPAFNYGPGNAGRCTGGQGGRGNGGRGNGDYGNGGRGTGTAKIYLTDTQINQRKGEGFLFSKVKKTPRFNHIFKNGNGKSACNGHMFCKQY